MQKTAIFSYVPVTFLLCVCYVSVQLGTGKEQEQNRKGTGKEQGYYK